MKINKNLVEQYKAILIEASLPPIPPEEPTAQDTTNDEYMMSMGPPGLPGLPVRFPPGVGLDFMKTWQHMPAWLRGVRNYQDFVRRWTERLPKLFRPWFPEWDDQLWDLIAQLGILPENIIWTPMVVIVNGVPTVRYIPFGRSSDGKLYLLDGNWRDYQRAPNGDPPFFPYDINHPGLGRSGVFEGINGWIHQHVPGGHSIHPGYYDPNYNWNEHGLEWNAPNDAIRDLFGTLPDGSGGYRPGHPFSLNPNNPGQLMPTNPNSVNWPNWLGPLLIAPFFAIPWLQDQGGALGQEPQSPATAPYWQA